MLYGFPISLILLLWLVLCTWPVLWICFHGKSSPESSARPWKRSILSTVSIWQSKNVMLTNRLYFTMIADHSMSRMLSKMQLQALLIVIPQKDIPGIMHASNRSMHSLKENGSIDLRYLIINMLIVLNILKLSIIQWVSIVIVITAHRISMRSNTWRNWRSLSSP